MYWECVLILCYILGVGNVISIGFPLPRWAWDPLLWQALATTGHNPCPKRHPQHDYVMGITSLCQSCLGQHSGLGAKFCFTRSALKVLKHHFQSPRISGAPFHQSKGIRGPRYGLVTEDHDL